MFEFYRRIWDYTWRDQLLLIGLSVLVALIAAAPLKLQQQIINRLVGDQDKGFLVWACLLYLLVLIVSAGLKFGQAFFAQRLGEATVRRLRKRVYEESIANELPGGGRGTLVNVLSSEVEGVGGFVGASISAPVMQIGTMLSVVGFIAAHQPGLGLIAILVIVPQILIVVIWQKRINATVAERTRLLRSACNRVSMDDLREINGAVISEFETIYDVRIRNFKLKLSSKFLQGLITGIGNSAILFIGGVLVMDGKADAGIVVASLSGLARLNGPWRELVGVYRMASAMHVSFGMIIGQFPTLIRPKAGEAGQKGHLA